MFNGRHLKYVLSQSSANTQQIWYVLPWELAKAQMESAWKQELCGSVNDLSGMHSVSQGVGLRWWYCPDLLIKTPWGTIDRSWGVGAMEGTLVWKCAQYGRLTCTGPWASHLLSWLDGGRGSGASVCSTVKSEDWTLWGQEAHVNAGVRTTGWHCSGGGQVDC